MDLTRRTLVTAAATLAAMPAGAQHHPTLPTAEPAAAPFARLRPNDAQKGAQKGAMEGHLMPDETAQRVTDSPAPPGPQGHWEPRASLPVARSEMAWGTAWANRLHVVGGYGATSLRAGSNASVVADPNTSSRRT